MTSRLHFFPRLDVREAPTIGATNTGAQWRREWALAVERAASINAIPSRYSDAPRTPKTAGLDETLAERRRLAEIFEGQS